MIGNRVTRRVPFRTMPGARLRIRMARRLEQRYGNRFAVFGNGWRGPCAHGPCGFDEQQDVYTRSAATIGVNNSTWPLVFSNRLPIALATGIPLAYGANPHVERVFGDEMGDVFFHDEHEAIARIDWLLSRDSGELREISERNRQFFERNLTTVAVCRHVVELAARWRARDSSSVSARAPSMPGTGTGIQPRWQSIPPLSSDR
jgi:hypothetical protein